MDSYASMYFGLHMSEQKDVRMFPPVPMVYETMPAEPLQWEYHVLVVDPREGMLPDTETLNELGSAGWLLVAGCWWARCAPKRPLTLSTNWVLWVGCAMAKSRRCTATLCGRKWPE